MRNFEKKLIGLILGAIFPIFFFMLSIVIWFLFDKSENSVFIYPVVGILLGLVINLIFFKNWIAQRYSLPLWFLFLIYAFYNLCIFGFFMGVPVFNIIMGIPAGYYYGKRILYNKIQPDEHTKIINRVSLFTGFIMALICYISALIALTDPTTGENIQLMFGLSFEITKEMVYAIIFTGGLGLIVSQFFITKFIAVKTIKNT